MTAPTPERRLPIADGRAPLLAICLLAFLLRAALSLAHPFILPDSLDYKHLALALLHHQPYEVSHEYASRIPGYPVFLALIYAIAHTSDRAVFLLQSALGAASCYITYKLASLFSRRLALFAALLLALDPLSIAFAASLLSEIPYTFTLLLSLLIVLRLFQNPTRLTDWLLLSLLSAAQIYLRAEALYLNIPLVIALWLHQFTHQSCDRTGATASQGSGARGQGSEKTPASQNSKLETRNLKLLLYPLLTAALILAALLPWWIRNHQIVGGPFFRMTTHEGISLYEAVYPQATGGPLQDRISQNPPPQVIGLAESDRDLAYTRLSWHYVFQDPLRILKLAVIKAARTWSPWLNATDFQNPLVNAALTCWYIPLFALALVGLLKRRLPTPLLLIILIPILYFTALHALFLGSVRYRVQAMPLVDLLAAGGIPMLKLKPDDQQTYCRRIKS